jgi:hypothetical protein
MHSAARHVRIRAWRALAGAFFGAGLSSLAQAATGKVPSFGPQTIEVFGYPVPVLSALFGLIGVLLARRVAPVSPGAIRLGNVGNMALTTLLALGVLALVVTGEKRPLVALGWAVGLGYSGLASVELVSQAVMKFAALFTQAFLRAAVGNSTPVEPASEEKP